MSDSASEVAIRLIDWMMTLPHALAVTFGKENEMPIITPTEQRWLKKDEAKGRSEASALSPQVAPT